MAEQRPLDAAVAQSEQRGSERRLEPNRPRRGDLRGIIPVAARACLVTLRGPDDRHTAARLRGDFDPLELAAQPEERLRPFHRRRNSRAGRGEQPERDKQVEETEQGVHGVTARVSIPIGAVASAETGSV